MAAQLLPIDLVAPGFRGVNYERKQSVLNPAWATLANNAVLDSDGRLASRRGYQDITTTEITSTPAIKTLHEYLREDNTSSYVIAWNGGIGTSIADPEGTDISGAVTDTDGSWWFQNYNDKCIGFQDGQKPIVYSGSGSFATVVESSGTAPTVADSVGLCAYGRVWALDSDRQTIKFTGLLDETNWGSTGAGSIDMQNIWTKGTDRVKAISAFNGALIVFGERHIVIWVDGSGSQLGLNPDNIYVAEVVEGVGCISQWSIQRLDDDADMVFLSKSGLQLLGRVVSAGGSAPLKSLTQEVSSEFKSDALSESESSVRSVCHKGKYILSFPTTGRSWCFFYEKEFKDESGEVLFPITTWDLAPTAWLNDEAGDRLLLGFAGNVGQYGTVDTDNGTTFTFSYESAWLDLGEGVANRLKILKRVGSIVFAAAATTVSYKWDFDFKGQWTSKSATFNADGVAEWGIAEWTAGVGETGYVGTEWSGGLSLRIVKLPGSGSGQYIKLGLTADISSQVSVQQLEIFSKLGRVA